MCQHQRIVSPTQVNNNSKHNHRWYRSHTIRFRQSRDINAFITDREATNPHLFYCYLPFSGALSAEIIGRLVAVPTGMVCCRLLFIMKSSAMKINAAACFTQPFLSEYVILWSQPPTKIVIRRRLPPERHAQICVWISVGRRLAALVQ